MSATTPLYSEKWVPLGDKCDELTVICTYSEIIVLPGGVLMQNLATVFISEDKVSFETPSGGVFIVAVVLNDSEKPYSPRGMRFPTDLKDDYVYKRSVFDRIFKRVGKPAIPPHTARLAILTRKINAPHVIIESFE